MKKTLPLAVIATTSLLLTGCASVTQNPTTMASVDNKCKVVMAQPARLNYDPAKATESEKVEARSKLAAIELKRPANRNTASGFDGAIDQALRDCL